MPGIASPSPRSRRIYATVPPQEILPIVDRNYESNVKGIYVIGDVTGLPLVKVAANHGVDVIERMTQRGVFKRSDEDGERLDLVIVGAGPAGVSAAIEAAKRGWKYILLERSSVASTVRGFPPGKKVYAEPRFLSNRSEIPVEGDREKTDFLNAVDEAIARHDVHVKTGVEVKRVRKVADRHFEVETTTGQSFPARQVIVAVGRQGQPRRLHIPGEDLQHKVTYRLHTAEDYHGKNVLVVGGGNSAVEAALMLCDHNRVTLSYRGSEFFRLKVENQQRFNDAIAENRLTVLFESNVKAIRDKEVDIEVADQTETRPNDHVLILIGSLPPIPFLVEMGLELDGVWTPKRVVWSIVGILVGCLIYFQARHFALLPDKAGDGVTTIPGFSWLFKVVPDYFGNLYGFYYLMYFSLIAVFGVYCAVRYRHSVIWRRNIIIILTQWTLWWGIPTFLAAAIGRNALTPVLLKTLNAWPLNMGALQVAPAVGPGDPSWWSTVAVIGVVWAVVLTFIVLPIFTIFVGKHYCSHICSCGALAETVGNRFRHRGPKGDWPRYLERFGFLFILLAAIATGADALGYPVPLDGYNVWVGTLLAGALAIGLYPFLGQRIWCRYWCPLAFWLNFWGRWSRFKISPEPGKCIDCNVCNQYCQMGIDIKTRALQGKPVTLVDTPCVACAECVARCPMEILHLGDLPAQKPYAEGTDAGADRTVRKSVRGSVDLPRMNDMSMKDRLYRSKNP